MRIVPSATLGTVFWISWTADQKKLFVTRKAQGGTELLHVDLEGHTESLRKCFGKICFGFPSPDGRHLAIMDSKSTMNMWVMENS